MTMMTENPFPENLTNVLEKGKGPGELIQIVSVDSPVWVNGAKTEKTEKKVEFQFLLEIGNTLSISATPKVGKGAKMIDILNWLTDNVIPVEVLKDGNKLWSFLQGFVGKKFTVYYEPNEKNTWTKITQFRPIDEVHSDFSDMPNV